MNFERRDFLRAGAAGLAGAMFGLESAYGQSTDKSGPVTSDSTIEFGSGTGSLHIELKFNEKAKTPGTLDLRLDNFRRGSFKPGFEKSLIMSGSFQPVAANHPATKLYRSYFSVDGLQVFARLVDDNHSTTLAFSPTSDQNILFLTVWNDSKPPETFRVDKNKFRGAGQQYPSDQKQPNPPSGVTEDREKASELKGSRTRPNPQSYVLDDRWKLLDLKGSRTPPEITAEDLENALDKHPDYVAFARGKKYMRLHAAVVDFVCLFVVVAVPGGELFVVDWEG